MKRLLALVAACSGSQKAPPPPPADAAIARPTPPDAAPPGDAFVTSLIPHDADPNAVRVIVTDSDGGPCGHVFLDRIYFPPNSSEIQPHQQAMAKMLAEAIACVTNDGSITKLEVGGHADDKERDPQRISEDRAVTMANYLAKNGVSPKLLKVVGYGKTLPLDKKKTESARAKNRRIEFLILERKPED